MLVRSPVPRARFFLQSGRRSRPSRRSRLSDRGPSHRRLCDVVRLLRVSERHRRAHQHGTPADARLDAPRTRLPPAAPPTASVARPGIGRRTLQSERAGSRRPRRSINRIVQHTTGGVNRLRLSSYGRREGDDAV